MKSILFSMFVVLGITDMISGTRMRNDLCANVRKHRKMDDMPEWMRRREQGPDRSNPFNSVCEDRRPENFGYEDHRPENYGYKDHRPENYGYEDHRPGNYRYERYESKYIGQVLFTIHVTK